MKDVAIDKLNETEALINPGKCLLCGRPHKLIQVKIHDYETYLKGKEKIQDLMPYLSLDEREILISGVCSECFDTLNVEEDG